MPVRMTVALPKRDAIKKKENQHNIHSVIEDKVVIWQYSLVLPGYSCSSSCKKYAILYTDSPKPHPRKR